MTRQPARVLEPADVRRLITHATRRRHDLRDKTIILLSFKAGLRACEIAGLTWSMVLQTDGRIADHLSVSKHIAKYGSGRRVPLHPELHDALAKHHAAIGKPSDGAVIQSERGGHMTARSIVNWFQRAYSELDLKRLAEAKAMGDQAHQLTPKDYRPCTLLGAVYIELGDLAAGHEWFMKAEQLGANQAAVDQDIRSLLARASLSERERIRAFLLGQDPERFAWLQTSRNAASKGAMLR